MKKIKTIALLIALLLCLGIFTAQAETLPTELSQTQPTAAEPLETQPVSSAPNLSTDPTDPSEPATGATGTTDTTDTTEPATEETEPAAVTRPTEYSEPSTYSDYVSPAPIYTPGNQDYDKKDWENIELNLDDKSSNGSGSFLNIKNNNSKEDQKNPLLLILCIVFWCLALSAITFLLLFRPEKKAAHATSAGSKTASKAEDNAKEETANHNRAAKGKTHRRTPENYERKYSDDYNDGF